jgi:glycosyltransferase involved in cell wall biosynthesis
MARVAVLHNTLDFQGGADVVCLESCRALARDHEVTLFTVSETEPHALADRFGVDLSGVRVRRPPANRAVAGLFAAAAPWTGPQLALRSVVLRRWFLGHAGRFDLAVSTANELALPLPSVQYVHYPQFRERRRRNVAPDGAGGLSAWLNEGWSRLAAPSGEALASERTRPLANSAWTADVVAGTYGVRPAVLHPPVDPVPCDRAWGERENGIVTVGRLAPDKRVREAIDTVDGLRARGHDTHLHIVGSAPRAYRQYAARIAAAVDRRDHVALERDVSQERLETLLCTHRYGLNAKRREHFGMAVAEYVAAGMVAFAPDSGGQREVVPDERLFDTTEEAIEGLAAAMADPAPPAQPRDRFASERFRRALRGAVAGVIQ